MAKRIRQEVVVESEGNLNESKRYSHIQLFNEDGTPFTGGGEAPTPANRLVPEGGTNGQVVKADADGNPVWGSDTDTTYTTGTAAELEAGTDTVAQVWSAQAIHDEIARQIAAIPAG